MRIIFYAMLILLLLSNEFGRASDYEITKVIKFIPDGGGPKWSPEGKYLSYYLEGYLYLYDVVADSSWQTARFHGYNYEWLNDSQIVFINTAQSRNRGTIRRDVTLTFFTIGSIERGIESDSIREFVSETGSPPSLFSDNSGTVALIMSDTTILLSSNGTNRGAKRSRFFRPAAYHSDIWLINLYGKKLQRVTENQEYILPILSPNGLLISALDMSGHIIIMDTNGVTMVSLPPGVHPVWTSKSDYLIYATSVEDGYTILGGDVFRYSLVSDTVTQLTFTPNVAEMKPQVSPDGTMIAYRTFRKAPDGIEILLLEGGQR